MPLPGHRWRHVTINTLHSWLHGDPRGFRDRGHRLHSSGDYRQPPPPGEHAGLHAYRQAISGPPVIIPPAGREAAGRAILAAIADQGLRVLALAVGATHAHLAVEMPDRMDTLRQQAGIWKKNASHALGPWLPGRVWGRGGSFTPVDSRDHLLRVVAYIVRHKEEGAWVWSYREEAGRGREEGSAE